MQTKKLHISWLIAWTGIGILLGTAICAFIDPHLFNDSFWLLVAVILSFVVCFKRQKWCVVLAIFAGGLTGLVNGSALKSDIQKYQPYFDHTVSITGRVDQDASYGAKGDQRLTISNAIIDDTKLAGTVWVSINKADIKRGDIVTVTGLLKPGFGNLSATMYRAKVERIIRPSPGDVARRGRDYFADGARKAIPEPQVSLGLGYLVGQKTALPKELEENIKIVGLTHAVVASGYNLTILVIFCRAFFLRISKFVATLLSSLLVGSFMLITGLSPSMSRAGLVACLGLLVWYYGRKTHPFVLLSFAAAVTVLIDPSYIWGDLGWYLSFSSFIGVIVLAPLVQRYFWGLQSKIPMMRQLIIDTLCAQVITLPIILLTFGTYSVYALPANILVLPLVPLAMLFTFIAGIAGLLTPSIAELAGFPAKIALGYSIEVINRIAQLPNSQKVATFNLPFMIASYIVLCIIITFLIRRTHHDFRDTNQANTI